MDSINEIPIHPRFLQVWWDPLLKDQGGGEKISGQVLRVWCGICRAANVDSTDETRLPPIPRASQAAAELLGTDDIRLAQAGLMHK